MSSHQRRKARRAGKRSWEHINAWIRANLQAISGGDCPECLVGRVRAHRWLAGDRTRSCDLCPYSPGEEPRAHFDLGLTIPVRDGPRVPYEPPR